MAKKKIYKLNYKNLFLFIGINIFFIFIIISIIKLIYWYKDSINTNTQVDKIFSDIKIEEINNDDDTIILDQKNINENNPYWDYIKMNFINVNIEELKEKNNETKGWIQVNGTNINYPFVQTTDNDFYLNHSFDKSYNDAGWVFMDYRNNPNNFDKNTILYAHARKDKTMFGSLKNILTNDWLKNKDNYIIKLSTEKENTLWQIFSIYHIPTTNDYLQIEFENNQKFYNFTQKLINRSIHNFNTNVTEEDIILTLSTCYSNNEKLVIHAKLIKKDLK